MGQRAIVCSEDDGKLKDREHGRCLLSRHMQESSGFS
jgi:hypothetical protein